MQILEEELDDAAEETEIDNMRIKKRKKAQKERDDKSAVEEGLEMKKLENVLFASLHSPIGFANEDEQEKSTAMFYVDRSANNSLISCRLESLDDHSDEEEEPIVAARKPVWVDEEEKVTKINIARVNRLRKLRKEEDESLISGSEYVSRLRAQHSKMNPCTEWAKPDSGAPRDYDNSSDDEDPENLLESNEDLVVKSSSRGGKLLPGRLEFSRLVDANAEDRSKGVVNSVEFHRNAQLLLAAGLDRRLRFFQIDGKRNAKIQSVFLEDCPVRKAAFLPDGSQVVVSGRRKFFYTFDLVKARVDKIGPLVGREEKSLELFEVSPDSTTIAFAGNEGYILLVSTKTKELVGTLKMNGTVRSMAFSGDGKTLLSSGGDGQIYHWDLRTRTCLHKGIDEGCLNGTSLASSPIGSLFAAGSGSGVVNVYNGDEFLGGKRKPVKSIENLTTSIDFMKFNGDGQILAICSRMKKNSVRLVHVPSFTVFSNWPPPNKTMRYPQCLDFSPGGGFMAMGNAAGNVLLYKLHHYSHA